jgi:hypothetical protein
MFFRSLPTSNPSLPRFRPPFRRPTSRLRVETLEDRNLLAGIVSLSTNDPDLLVGERVLWTATATDVGATPVYQFRVAPHGGTLHLVRDFSPASTFTWTPMQEGAYDIEVIVKDGYQATETTSALVLDDVASRVAGSQAVVSPTLNPLVALYSVPPALADTVFVQFAVAGDDPAWRNTDSRAVAPGMSTNVFVAGMLPNTTYQMRHVFSDGAGSEPLTFTTGSIPANLTIPAFTVQQPPGPESELDQDMVFHQTTGGFGNVPNPLATDLLGRVMWYYDVSQSGLTRTFAGQNLAPGGAALILGVDPYAPLPGAMNVLREVDLAGNVVRETNMDVVNSQLTDLGFHPIHTFTHDVERLPNGQTVVIGVSERAIDIDNIPTNYLGMSIVVLDHEFQVTWAWDAFDHLDVNRKPVLGEIIQPGAADQVSSSTPVVPAVNWLHINTVSWSPADQNLVLSIRNQDWVIKIDYRDGAGDGHVVWRLGQGGDFTINSDEANPWFSHQHDAHYVDDHTLILFDNGNTRRASDPTARSRGQVWTLDETNMTATLTLNADLGNYSMALGSAQQLANGNYCFTSGFQGQAPNIVGQSIELRPDGGKAYVLQANRMLYHSFRMRTLYEGIDDSLKGAPQQVESVVLNDGAAQRSMVSSLTVTFGGAVVLDPGAIELRRQDGSMVGLHADISILDGKTRAVLTFAGMDIIGGSLADGNYSLAIRADRVHDRWGRELDGDGNGATGGDRAEAFFRLFGDSDGDRDVDLLDLGRFLSTLGRKRGDSRYLGYFDVNGDDRIGLIDLLALARRLGADLDP